MYRQIVIPDIGLTARMRAGKDEVYKIIKELGCDVERVAFGDSLKQEFHRLFPHIPKEPKPIDQLVLFGQSMRAIYPNIWVDRTMKHCGHVRMHFNSNGLLSPSFVFTDIRQPNEFKAVHDMGAFTVRVEALESVRIERMIALGEEPTEETLNSPTEQFVDRFPVDYTIVNNGDRGELEEQIKDMLKKIA